jgi:acetylornithine deacetylase/succinyl-diaminopimelate desuccinylase-like protein
MITFGKVNVHPGSFSAVPGEVDFSLDFRSASPETLKVLENELLTLAEDVASTRGLAFYSRIVDKTEPVMISPRILGILKEECQKLNYPFLTMTSGAGHDAQIISAVAEAGMIFIPCIDGISHSPEEMIRWEDLKKGANLLLHAILRLAS